MAFIGGDSLSDVCADIEHNRDLVYVIEKKYFTTILCLAAYTYLLQTVLAYILLNRIFKRSGPPYNTLAFKAVASLLFILIFVFAIIGFLFMKIGQALRSMLVAARPNGLSCVTGNLRRTAASSSIVYQQTTMPPPDPASEVLDIGLIGHVSDESDYDL